MIRRCALACVLALSCGAATDLGERAPDAGADLACRPGGPMLVVASGVAFDEGTPLAVDAASAFFTSAGLVDAVPSAGGAPHAIDSGSSSPARSFAETTQAIVLVDAGGSLAMIPKSGGARTKLDTGGAFVESLATAGDDVYFAGPVSVARAHTDGTPPDVILETASRYVLATARWLYALPQSSQEGPAFRVDRASLAVTSFEASSGDRYFGGPTTLYRVHGATADVLGDGDVDFGASIPLPPNGYVIAADDDCVYAAIGSSALVCVHHDGAAAPVGASLAGPRAVASDGMCVWVADGSTLFRFSKP